MLSVVWMQLIIKIGKYDFDMVWWFQLNNLAKSHKFCLKSEISLKIQIFAIVEFLLSGIVLEWPNYPRETIRFWFWGGQVPQKSEKTDQLYNSNNTHFWKSLRMPPLPKRDHNKLSRAFKICPGSSYLIVFFYKMKVI